MKQADRRDATRDKLYAAAVELIAEQGFAATTVDAIADRAGVAKGTVYYNFGSKTALFEQLLTHGVARLTERLRAATAGLPPAEAVPALVAAQLAYLRDYRAFAQLLLSEMWRTNNQWHQTVALVRGEVIGTIGEVIAAGVAAGDFAADLDVGLAASALFGVALVVGVDWLVFQPERDIDDVLAGLSAIVTSRLRPAPEDGRRRAPWTERRPASEAGRPPAPAGRQRPRPRPGSVAGDIPSGDPAPGDTVG
ncbi:TetR/AcrR family transcriptional regulator [Actinocatenispora comari]|jgi:AcrR family transcriptional regulator|uniref:TetR family transcriptional regulator n=1 Tax=Actinocatenispora comari TaxID=2807577 RepID=A0A8J4AHX9_9ACTN|nr:TetR/AcrR family transcriptional regulator [Actinocatenispora comari]GIL30042.1 TetR family transcriptional regulator [Actinocatenispora comari]